MAANWCEDLNRYTSISNMQQGAWAQIDTGWAISTANPPRAGGKHMRLSGSTEASSGIMRRQMSAPTQLTAGKQVGGFATRMYFSALPLREFETAGTSRNADGIVLRQWRNSVNNVQVTTVLGTDGSIQAYQADPNSGFPDSSGESWVAARLGLRSAQCVFPQTYHHFEDRIYVNDGAGTYELRVDGVTRINVPVGDTDPQDSGDISQGSFGYWAYPGATGPASIGVVMDVADMHAWDNQSGQGPATFVGNAGVLPRAFVQDTSFNEWLITGGIHGYVVLSDNDLTTYISTGTIGAESGFLAAAVDSDVIGIVYQQINFFGEKTDAGNCNVLVGFLGLGGETRWADAASIMNAGMVWKWGIIDSDPHTLAPWTPGSATESAALFQRTL